MTVFQRLRKYKEKALNEARTSWNDYREEKAELKKVYKEELRKAKIDAAKQKATLKKDAMIRKAKADAEAGGRAKRLLKDTFKAIKDNREERLKREGKRNNTLPMFK